jgi:hypothetical protein
MSHMKTSAVPGVVALVMAFSSSAQTPSANGIPDPAPPTLSRLDLTCADFKHTQNGGWSPLRPIQVGTVTIRAGVTLRDGVAYGGVRLVALLKNECR